MSAVLLEADTKLPVVMPKVLLLVVFLTTPPFWLPSPGDGNEAIGALIQNYIREIEELR